jgi:cell division protein FtsI (penicillin-binding protein 3)
MIALMCVFSLGLCTVVGRVYYLQVVLQQEIAGRATPVDREITFKPRRGSILDRQGVELAVSVKVPSIFADPRDIKDPADAARQLAPLLELDRAELERKLGAKKSFVWLARQVTPPLAEQISALKLRGIGITYEHKRFYPQGSVAGQLLGFTGIDGNGLEGLERAMEEQLAGDKFQLQAKRDASGKIMLTDQTPRFEQLEGRTVRLSLDSRIQRVAEQALAEQVEKFKAKGGYAVVLDAKTGEILALANTPSFDPNRVQSHEADAWRLRPITDTFEPGSVVKPFVLAATLQERTVRLDTRIMCEGGRLQIGRHTIRDTHPHNELSAAQVVQVSSNICAYKLAQTLQQKGLYQYYRLFGFGARSGLGVRGEQAGYLRDPSKTTKQGKPNPWPEVTFANIAFGQGFTATPLQVTVAAAAIANGGLLMKPTLVHSIVDKDGQVVEHVQPQLVRRVVSPEVARQTAWAMSLVTTREGTAIQAALPKHTVAGKTGTAQKVNPKTRRYDANMWLASFVGFLPAERPEIVIGVYVDEPHGSHYGGVVAAPVFKKIAIEAIQVRGIAEVPTAERFDLSKYSPSAASAALKAAEQEQGAPAAEEIFTLPAERLVDVSVAEPAEAEGQPRMPNLTGLTARDALARLKEAGAPLPQVHGWGRVVAQTPEVGAPWDVQEPVILELLPPTGQGALSEEPSSGEAAR